MWLCPKCNKYKFSTVKQCACKPFTVINEDGDEYEVYAMDKEDAALKYAEKSNEENEYYLLESSVIVTIDGDQFEISAEPSINYSANEI